MTTSGASASNPSERRKSAAAPAAVRGRQLSGDQQIRRRVSVAAIACDRDDAIAQKQRVCLRPHAAADDRVDLFTLHEIGHLLVSLQSRTVDQALGGGFKIVLRVFIYGKGITVAEMLVYFAVLIGYRNTNHVKSPLRSCPQWT